MSTPAPDDDMVTVWDSSPASRVDAINWELRLIEMRQRIKRLRLNLIDAHVKLLRDEKEFHAALDEADTLEAKMREWKRAT